MVCLGGNLQAQAASLCLPDEAVVFSCGTRSGKTVAVCTRAPDGRADGGALRYRYGKPGRIELEYPAHDAGSFDRFEHYHYFRAGVDRTSLSFQNGAVRYSIFDDDEAGEKPPASAGVTVDTGKAGRGQTIDCIGKPQAHWSLIDGAVPCSDEALNSCQRN